MGEAEYLPTFLEERRFRRVQVFWFAFSKHPSAKGDDLAFLIHDWEHDSVAKTVVQTAVLVLDHQSRLLQAFNGVVLKHCAKVLPAIGRVANTEFLGDFPADAARFQVVDGLGGFF